MAAVSLSVLQLVLFALLLWSNGGPVDDGACELGCGPVNMVLGVLILGLFPVAWLVSLLLVIVCLIRRSIAVGIGGLLVLGAPVVVLIAMSVSFFH